MRSARRVARVNLAFALMVTAAAVVTAGGGQRRGGPSSRFVTPAADDGKRIEARHGMVSSANALASEAGVAALRVGGNAVDAAVAAAFAIGVVEPQMSGLGGSGAALVWMAREGRPSYLDFYAAQPADSWHGHTRPAPSGARAANPGQDQSGQRPEPSELPGPTEPGDLRVVGIPGAVAGLLALHDRFGVLSREQVMASAIRLAQDGFPVGQILSGFIAAGATRMKPSPKAMSLYFPGGTALAPGEVVRNPELAESLRRIARDGAKGFYEGPTAEAMVETLHAGGHPATRADLMAYRPQWKRPLCAGYRGLTVLSAPPPQMGFQVLHTLELLESFNPAKLGPPTRSPAAFDLLTSALRVGQASARANADPNWVRVPAAGISSPTFAASREALVGKRVAAKSVAPADAGPFDGDPVVAECRAYDPYRAAPTVPTSAPPTAAGMPRDGDAEDDPHGETTHLSVVDRDGNAISLTLTNSDVWGSGGFTGGFFLNNSGFRFTDENIDAPSANRWRVRTTTIAPTLVLEDGAVKMVIGAPGGGRIPTEIVQVMVYVLDYGLDPLDAVNMPRIFPAPGNPRVQIEHGFTPQLLADVRTMGYEPVAESAGYARLYLIVRRGAGWVGVADPRHDGQPRGY